MAVSSPLLASNSATSTSLTQPPANASQFRFFHSQRLTGEGRACIKENLASEVLIATRQATSLKRAVQIRPGRFLEISREPQRRASPAGRLR